MLLASDGDRKPRHRHRTATAGALASVSRGRRTTARPAFAADYGRSFWQAYWQGPLSILGLTYPYYAQTTFVSDSIVPGIIMSRDGLPIGSADYDSNGNLIFQDGAVIRGVDKNWKNQVVDQLSLNVQRQVARNLVVDVGYLHVKGGNNLRVQNINLAPPGPPGQSIDANRPLHSTYPELADVPISYSKTNTWYDAVTAQVRGQVGRYINVAGELCAWPNLRQRAKPQTIRLGSISRSFGPGHRTYLQFAGERRGAVSDAGRKFGSSMHPALDAIAGGWQYSGFIFLRSGTRFSVSGNTSLNNAQTNRPDRIADGNLPVDQRTLDHWYDTDGVCQACGLGDLRQRGYQPAVRRRHVTTGFVDFQDLQCDGTHEIWCSGGICSTRSITRISIRRRRRVGSGSNGRVTSTSVGPRGMQFGLRLFF